MHHEQDIDEDGRPARRHPRDAPGVRCVGVIAIAGFPLSRRLLLEGRDPALGVRRRDVPGHALLLRHRPAHRGTLTSFYMFRLYFRVVPRRGRAPRDVLEHVHEPPEHGDGPALRARGRSRSCGGCSASPEAFVTIQDATASGTSGARPRQLAPHGGRHAHHVSAGDRARDGGGRDVGRGDRGHPARALALRRRPELPARIAASARGVYRDAREQVLGGRALRPLIVRPLRRVSDAVLYPASTPG